MCHSQASLPRLAYPRPVYNPATDWLRALVLQHSHAIRARGQFLLPAPRRHLRRSWKTARGVGPGPYAGPAMPNAACSAKRQFQITCPVFFHIFKNVAYLFQFENLLV